MSTPDAGSDAAALAAGLPDLAVLNRLAGEFFSALPGLGSAGGEGSVRSGEAIASRHHL